MLYLNDVAAASVGVVIEHRSPRPIPRRKTLSWDVPGRSGKLVRELEAWENVSLDYELAVVPLPNTSLPDTVDRAVAWLSQGGEMRLYDDTDPSVFYLVRAYGGGSLAPILRRARRAKISFDADPRRFLLSGERAVTLSTSGSVTLQNPAPYKARPLIHITGSSASALSGALTVGATVLSFADGRDLLIDCDKKSSSAALSVSGDFPALSAGETAISLTGAGLSAEILPRWFTL